MGAPDATLAYLQLGPDEVLSAVESRGYQCDGRLLALNSYENRVYQVGLEDSAPLVAKFYRPQRWTDDQILEEHAFTLELAAAEIDVVPPIRGTDGATLHTFRTFRFALFPRRGGRPPDLENTDHLKQLGRMLARVHRIGSAAPFRHRPALTIQTFGENSCHYLLENGFIPDDLDLAYRSLTEDLLVRIRRCYDRAGECRLLRLHGDCHPGNVLWSGDGPLLVDLDDARTGPAVQDLWMFLSGDTSDQTRYLHALLDGYSQFHDFEPIELHLVEALRTLRLMHYYAWLAQRWRDPAFPRAFPWFNTHRAWEEHILMLREQAALMDEPPLIWP